MGETGGWGVWESEKMKKKKREGHEKFVKLSYTIKRNMCFISKSISPIFSVFCTVWTIFYCSSTINCLFRSCWFFLSWFITICKILKEKTGEKSFSPQQLKSFKSAFSWEKRERILKFSVYFKVKITPNVYLLQLCTTTMYRN